LPDSATVRSARLIAAGFGSGWLPKAPGTWGSLASLPFAWWVWHGFGATGLWFGTVALLLLGCAVCAVVLRGAADTDPGWIVIDEWAGQWCCLALVAGTASLNLWWVMVGFIAFRLFDIWKPWPISRLEHWGAPWWSIMADDMMAGFFGGIILTVAGGVA
jgi:phosphatidylglycerophosphatase A